MKNVNEFYNNSKKFDKPSGLLRGFFNMNLNKDLEKKIAIDLGAGVGNDTNFLINNGFKVTCIDKEKDSEELILNKIENKDRINIVVDDFENVKLHKADLIYSCFSLCFCNPNNIDNLMNEIIENIIPGGYFVRKFSWKK